MLNIVIPMAGRGSRFIQNGYKLPKPLIEIHGRPMIEYVIKNITPIQEYRFIFLCLSEHIKKYNLIERLKGYSNNAEVIPIKQVTEGAACTVLLAQDLINSCDPLMIANSDQYVDFDINVYLDRLNGYDGLIMTMKALNVKWSYIRYDSHLVTEVREKEIISNLATVGIYNFKNGFDFVKYAKKMIGLNQRVNNEFYVAPVYNHMIEDGYAITYCDIGNIDEKMYGLGVPEDLISFQNNPLSCNVF